MKHILTIAELYTVYLPFDLCPSSPARFPVEWDKEAIAEARKSVIFLSAAGRWEVAYTGIDKGKYRFSVKRIRAPSTRPDVNKHGL